MSDYVTYFVEDRKSRSFISAHFCPLLDFDWVEHAIFFNNQINLALDFNGLTILFDLFLVATPVIGHTITIINSSVGIGLKISEMTKVSKKAPLMAPFANVSDVSQRVRYAASPVSRKKP